MSLKEHRHNQLYVTSGKLDPHEDVMKLYWRLTGVILNIADFLLTIWEKMNLN